MLGFTKRTFSVDSRWYSRRADIATFELDELLATKLRALYQRRKGRDLFDLATGLADKRSDAARIADSFREYMEREGGPVTRAMFERNLEGKIGDAQFNADQAPLARPAILPCSRRCARSPCNVRRNASAVEAASMGVMRGRRDGGGRLPLSESCRFGDLEVTRAISSRPKSLVSFCFIGGPSRIRT